MMFLASLPAWSEVVALVAPTLAVVSGILLNRRKIISEAVETRRVAAVAAVEANEQLAVIHVLVNNRLTQALNRIEELENSLIDHSVPVPPSEMV